MAAAPELRERFDARRAPSRVESSAHLRPSRSRRGQWQDFLVLEHLEGETLAGRLERGALPFELAITISHEIAGRPRWRIAPALFTAT